MLLNRQRNSLSPAVGCTRQHVLDPFSMHALLRRGLPWLRQGRSSLLSEGHRHDVRLAVAAAGLEAEVLHHRARQVAARRTPDPDLTRSVAGTRPNVDRVMRRDRTRPIARTWLRFLLDAGPLH